MGKFRRSMRASFVVVVFVIALAGAAPHRVAVVPASSLQGRAVVDEFLRGGAFEVYALSRRQEAVADLVSRGAIYRHVNMSDVKSLQEAFAGVESVWFTTVTIDKATFAANIGAEGIQGRAIFEAAKLVGVKTLLWSSAHYMDMSPTGSYLLDAKIDLRTFFDAHERDAGAPKVVEMRPAFFPEMWLTDPTGMVFPVNTAGLGNPLTPSTEMGFTPVHDIGVFSRTVLQKGAPAAINPIISFVGTGPQLAAAFERCRSQPAGTYSFWQSVPRWLLYLADRKGMYGLITYSETPKAQAWYRKALASTKQFIEPQSFERWCAASGLDTKELPPPPNFKLFFAGAAVVLVLLVWSIRRCCCGAKVTKKTKKQ